MSNEVTQRQTGALATTGDDDPYAEVAREISQRSIVGTLLKFSKGDWLAGEQNEEIPLGTQFVANMDELMRGWIRWEDGKPNDHRMGPVAQRFQPPRRGELGDLDKSQWEVDEKGNERDPWQESFYLLLKGTGDDDELYTFAASSKGARDCIGALCKDYSKGKRMQKEGMFPVVAIGTDHYDHPKKEYGRIKTPVLKVVGWAPATVFDEAGAAGEETVDPETGEVTGGTDKAAATDAERRVDAAAATVANVTRGSSRQQAPAANRPKF
jgi:hypothetical protein